MKVVFMIVIIVTGALAAPTLPGLPGYSPEFLGVASDVLRAVTSGLRTNFGWFPGALIGAGVTDTVGQALGTASNSLPGLIPVTPETELVDS